jgi:hypothetical protein
MKAARVLIRKRTNAISLIGFHDVSDSPSWRRYRQVTDPEIVVVCCDRRSN